MNKINNITFIYDPINNTCYIQASVQPIHELIIKGTIEYQGIVNGTWFQIDELTNHWISFRWNIFNTNKWEIFYKCVQNNQIAYYRRVFFGVEKIVVFSFRERDEWVKVEGKWQSKF